MSISFPIGIKTALASSGPKLRVYYPQAFGLSNWNFEAMINKGIVDLAQKMIVEQTGVNNTSVEEMLGTYDIKNNQRDVLSLSLSNYTYHFHAAHGMTYIKSLSFDLQKEVICQLKDLFKPGSDYIGELSKLINTQIKQRDIPLIDEFTTIKPDQDFYIADKTIVIYFQLYKFTPYVFGFPMFPISLYDIQDIIDENGPLGRLVENN